MRNRTSLVLMEQLVMVLVFALAAALCLGIFVEADRISEETACRDQAVLLAQNGAEVLKSCNGDLKEAADILDGTVTMRELTVESGGYTMILTLVDSGVTGLGQAEICVYAEGESIFVLRTGWQEENG
jgi:hypothetical protein